MHQVSFTEAYTAWRNRARKFNPESIVRGAIEVLGERSSDRVEDLQKAPWLTMLMVKWACQDRFPGRAHLPSISPDQLYELRQRLWKLPDHLRMGGDNEMPLGLFMRQLTRPQLGFQREFSKSFVREAALLAEQGEDYPLRRLFKKRCGFDVLEFIDLGLGAFGAICRGDRALGDDYFALLDGTYKPEVISSFRFSISRTFPELVTFCQSLPDARRKVASEYFEFPILSRYPFFRIDNAMICWHPMVFYRGLEGFVHSVLSEEGQDYIHPFSRVFERHVVSEAQKVPAQFVDEDALREFIAADTQVPDGLLSFPGCNVFVEAKAGLYHESVMTVGNREVFAHKTRAIRSAVGQAWATTVSLRKQRRAPLQVLDADQDYLLVVTNRELGASKGAALASMYPEGTLDYPSAEAEKLLPREHIYVLAIDDFERLTNAAADGQITLPEFLGSCVQDDERPETARLLFEQHLWERGVPLRFSRLVEEAVDCSMERLERAMSG